MSFIIKCLDCGHNAPYFPTSTTCPKCGSQWREAEYDYEMLGKTLPEKLKSRQQDLWRYRELLPVRNPNISLSLGEGYTPLIRAVNLGMMLGCPNIFIKDERQGPTSSFKDRQASVTIAALKEAGITEMVAASTGNVAISYSAYASRAGMKLWAFVTSLVPAVKMREIALYGSQVIKITGSYDQCKQVAAEFARQRKLYLDMGARTITSIEAMKTIAFEIAEQLTNVLGPDENSQLRTPDWYVQAISGGMGPIGVHKGFREMQQMGWVDKIPAFAPIQAEGCAPMVDSWKKGLAKAEPVTNPKTRIETLATGDPGRAYEFLKGHVDSSNGVFESVTDEEAFRAMHVLAKMEGISAEPAAGAAFAGLFKLIRAGVIKPSDTVVVNCTGHTMPAEQGILGENWARDVKFPSLAQAPQEEGLLSALTQVAPERFPKIAIVEDTLEARRLIRRILQSQGNFTILEAEDGRAGLDLVQKELPDLVILDLMMPEMDGFSVIEALRSNPETATIPVIVATAKELTPDEKNRLSGHIQALLQKGDFLNDEFLDEVRSLLK
ncbi:MAG TPA: pyridoxal-phosphate dependent enzyme [Anaerolineales bacterium]|nr:pyridoxal-phosphate dependent enzyme [Anaerolineales bacterium]HNB40041.1 pyridoxal-phosphate dependent enzyme [Anaerolineales bacterium]HNE03887.1 pyridoxal-phosphate dependent enzyme [Anaerolineales bacterium]HNF93843.1 pyridoxal-phosphate dependent enzyme [Anaerolineales bacterium]HNH26546.1 pyridoxal-phosphate dependent enzyme [Anaerolineales bacterium]